MISYFTNQIFDENPNLNIISFSDDSVLAVDPKDRKAHFFYQVNEDMSFHWNLLSEVGERFQGWFQGKINFNGYILNTKATETDFFNTLDLPEN